MSKTDLQLEKLRELRQIAKDLSDSVLDDLSPFVHQKDKKSFVRLPTSAHRVNDVGITVTCSCLMGLSLTGRLDAFTKLKPQKWTPDGAFELVVKTPRWTSSGLVNMNAFTSTLILRTFGMLVEKGKLRSEDAKNFVHHGIKEERRKINDGTFRAVRSSDRRARWTLKDVFDDLAVGSLENLRVEAYPVSAAILYWYLDAIDRSNLLRFFRDSFWNDAADWASREFWKQVSFVTAKNDAIMDPVAMAMAACICKKLKTVAEKLKNKKGRDSGSYLSQLPSEPELEFGLKLLFQCQTHSGIWPKYFPLFHYPDAGGNFCFTFEMLEAVLSEFGKEDVRLLEIDGAFEALSKALQWCKQNRLECQNEGRLYRGWNSGGQPVSLSSGKPESWATAVVHMFLWEVEEVLSRKIEQNLLTLYKAKKNKITENVFDEFLDVEILIRKKPRSLVSLLNKHIISHALKEQVDLRRNGLSEKVSALLFGPPGTSKTELCKAVAKRLGWPLVELDPSHFLKGGLEAISVHADRIFSDLMDLNGAVVLFDEMDALVQARDTEDWHLDTTSQLLTTSMLPKLAKLHEQRRVIFFMATNFQNRFDPAIKRAGRFDLLLCMGPPTRESKLSNIKLFLGDSVSSKDTAAIKKVIGSYVARDPEIASMFELFTFGETKALFRSLSASEPLLQKLKSLRSGGFKSRLKEEEEFKTLRIKDLESLPKDLWGKTIRELEKDERVNFEFLKEQLRFPIIRYIADKRQSKIQV